MTLVLPSTRVKIYVKHRVRSRFYKCQFKIPSRVCVRRKRQTRSSSIEVRSGLSKPSASDTNVTAEGVILRFVIKIV